MSNEDDPFSINTRRVKHSPLASPHSSSSSYTPLTTYHPNTTTFNNDIDDLNRPYIPDNNNSQHYSSPHQQFPHNVLPSSQEIPFSNYQQQPQPRPQYFTSQSHFNNNENPNSLNNNTQQNRLPPPPPPAPQSQSTYNQHGLGTPMWVPNYHDRTQGVQPYEIQYTDPKGVVRRKPMPIFPREDGVTTIDIPKVIETEKTTNDESKWWLIRLFLFILSLFIFFSILAELIRLRSHFNTHVEIHENEHKMHIRDLRDGAGLDELKKNIMEMTLSELTKTQHRFLRDLSDSNDNDKLMMGGNSMDSLIRNYPNLQFFHYQITSDEIVYRRYPVEGVLNTLNSSKLIWVCICCRDSSETTQCFSDITTTKKDNGEFFTYTLPHNFKPVMCTLNFLMTNK